MLKIAAGQDLLRRPRRNRKTSAVRGMVQENRLHPSDLVYPLFVCDGSSVKDPVLSMPGIFRLSIDQLLKEVERAAELGIPAIALFPVIPKELKDDAAPECVNPNGILQRAIRAVKAEFPQLCVLADIALDLYTHHAHDGFVGSDGEVLNDESVEMLVKMALVQAEAGVDMVAPSDMMDGRIKAIREGLDAQGFTEVSIHAYSAKYTSAFYGPYRSALFSHLKTGDKKTYQLNPANRREALLEAAIDEQEGADVLMVKPALPYLDVITKIREATHLPISAFQVTGEYSMIMAAAQNGWIDGDRAFCETLLSIKRAGADMIFTYAAPRIAELITIGALD